MWDENNYTCFLQPPSTSLIEEFDIVITKDGIHTLANIVIVDPT
jgi:hypothetical protein